MSGRGSKTNVMFEDELGDIAGEDARMRAVCETPGEPAPTDVSSIPRHATPCAFQGCAAFFHPAGGSTGVVLCSPWGFEDLVMRKSWRRLAEAISAAGYPCLRFDYPGTGDSLGRMALVPDADVWIRSIHSAAETLRRQSGVRRFVFIGQSLGAALATEAARTRTDVAALQLIAPVAKARAYVRELAATATMVAERIGIRLELAPDEGLNVVGFALSRTMVETLKALDLTRIETLRVPDVTIFDSPGRKAGAELFEHLRRIGVATRFEDVAPYHLMVSDATQIQALPVSADQVIAALRRVAPELVAAAAVASPSYPASLVAEDFHEEPVRYGPERTLFGVLSHPHRERSDRPAVVLLNRGLNPHIGWRRISVDHARALAATGIAALRIDVAGLGESLDEPSRPTDLIYSDLLMGDVRAAVDLLAQRGHKRIALVGVCSGAYVALSVADLDPRVTDVIAFNPQRFVWNPAESAEDVIRFGLRSVHDYVGDLRRGGALRKLVRSRRRIVPAAVFLLRKTARDAMSRIPLRLRSQVLRSSMAARVSHFFTRLADRGTRVSLVFSEGDPSLQELRAYFGASGRGLRYPNVSVEILGEADHNLTSGAASAAMLERIFDALAPGVSNDRRPSPATQFGDVARKVCVG